MKVFKVKFSKKIRCLLYTGIVLCCLCLILNIVSLCISDIFSSVNPIYPIIQHTFSFATTLIVGVILVCLLTSSYYSIKQGDLISSFGIIKSRHKIDEIEIINLDRKNKKLFLLFKNNSSISILIDTESYNTFVDELLRFNSSIEYTICSDEMEGDNSNRKK